jgi:hypothetical protein
MRGWWSFGVFGTSAAVRKRHREGVIRAQKKKAAASKRSERLDFIKG